MSFQDSLAEWSKALASGASPQVRGFEPHSCHSCIKERRHLQLSEFTHKHQDYAGAALCQLIFATPSMNASPHPPISPLPARRECVRNVSRKQLHSKRRKCCCLASIFKTVWPSGLRRWLQAPVRKGVGSNLTAVTCPRDLGDGLPPRVPGGGPQLRAVCC